MCDEWRESFEAFAKWADANGYTDDLTIDRKEANGNYCPDNCRWIKKSEQNWNQRRRRTAKNRFRGVKPHGARFVARISNRHLGVFDTEEEAARAYDAAAIELSGGHTFLNFPEMLAVQSA